jgi:serine/threonine protein kinase
MVEGVLGNESLALIESHVDSCEQCAAVIANLGALDSAAAKPRVVGRYQLDRRIGGGGMGEVWAAWDPQLRRDIAVKLVKPERADDGREAERLKREARALARLGHPNVLAVYDVGDVDGEVFIATELVVGDTLASRGGANADWRELVRLYAQAARGLAAAHAAGLVHRDIKPANLLIGTDGRVRVADFGLAVRSYTPSPVAPSLAASALGPPDGGHSPPAKLAGQADEKITQTGYIAGTPAYMAPEQRLGEPADARADQYALCVALAEGISGRRPPLDINAEAMMVFVGERRQREDDLDRVCAVIARGLSIVREERFEDMTAFASALEACLASAPSTTKTPVAPRPRRRTALLVGLASAAGIASAVVVWRLNAREEPAAPVTAVVPPVVVDAGVVDAVQTAVAIVPPDAPAMTISRTTPSKIPTTTTPPVQPIDDLAVTVRKALLRRDGVACIAALDRMPGNLPAATKMSFEMQRGQCEMLRGDCERGIKRVDAALEAQGYPTNGKALAVGYCPIEGPIDQRVERLATQAYGVTTPALCKRLAGPAKSVANDVTDARQKAQVGIALRILGRCVDDCAEAEALWKRAHELDQLAPAWDVKNCATPGSVPQQTDAEIAAAQTQTAMKDVQRAQDAISHRDMKTCRAFASNPPTAPKGIDTTVEMIAAYCTMMTGDCQGGTARLAKVHPGGAASAKGVAVNYCPIAGTLDERLYQMKIQLSAFADRRSGAARVEWCSVLVAPAKKAASEAQNDDQREAAGKILRNVAWCISLAGRCGEARELWSLATQDPPDLSPKCP